MLLRPRPARVQQLVAQQPPLPPLRCPSLVDSGVMHLGKWHRACFHRHHLGMAAPHTEGPLFPVCGYSRIDARADSDLCRKHARIAARFDRRGMRHVYRKRHLHDLRRAAALQAERQKSPRVHRFSGTRSHGGESSFSYGLFHDHARDARGMPYRHHGSFVSRSPARTRQARREAIPA